MRRPLVALARLLVIGVLFGYLGLALGNRLIVDQQPRRVDVIVVLGAPAEPDGTAGATLRARVDQAAALFHAGYAPAILFTGANVQNQHVEAAVMAAYARQLGLPADAQIIEASARTTKENARYAAEVMRRQHWRSAIVVTSPYHTRRAQHWFVAYGVDPIIVASTQPARLSWLQRLRDIMYEGVSWLPIWLDGR